jgi:hypothetical protein
MAKKSHRESGKSIADHTEKRVRKSQTAVAGEEPLDEEQLRTFHRSSAENGH